MKRIAILLLALVILIVPMGAIAADDAAIIARLTEQRDAAEPNVLPLSDGSDTLTIYMGMYGSQVYSSLKEHPVVHAITQITGINLEFVSPPEGDDGTFFNTIIASGEYPDIFRHEFLAYPGGVTAAIEDGVLVNLNPLVEKYAPNFLNELITRGASVYKHLVNDEGMYVRLGCYLDPEVLNGVQHTGVVIRQDFLDKVGRPAPRTIDELTDVLRAFKNDLGIEIPFAFAKFDNWVYTNSNFLSAPWNLAMNNYQIDENGGIYYSRIQDGYKEMLKVLNTWYNEGLIDRDFINRTTGDAKKLVYTNRSAACLVGNWETSEMVSLGQLEDPNFAITGLQMPRLNDPDEPLTCGGNREDGTDTMAWQISTACKKPELAMKFIDWLFTPEALVLATYGPGELPDGNKTYEEIDGHYEFTEFMTNNPDWDFNTIRGFYTIQDFQSQFHNDFITMQYDTDVQRQCWAAWRHNYTNDGIIPLTITRTVDEGRTYSRLHNEITTYTDEMIYMFICNEQSIDDNWDEYVETVKNLGLDQVIEIQTAAYQRWLNR